MKQNPVLQFLNVKKSLTKLKLVNIFDPILQFRTVEELTQNMCLKMIVYNDNEN